MDAIRVENVSKSFGNTTVLRDVNISWEPGKIHGLIGQNGSGKTVLIKCICGLMRYDSGKILVGGKQIGKEIEMPPDLGIIIETPGFLQRFSGYKNLRMLASIRNKISNEHIHEVMRIVGLDWNSSKPVSHYSLGMRQRLGIAQAIMEDPQLLIFDEPFNGLDKNGAAEIRQLFRRLRDEGRTLVVISHNPLDIAQLCDTVSEIDAGMVRCVTENNLMMRAEDTTVS